MRSASSGAKAAYFESVGIGVVYSLAGNILYAGSQWLISTFIVKAGGASLLGSYALSMAVIGPLLAISSMNLRAVLVTDASRIAKFEDYLGLRCSTSLLCIPVTAIGLWLIPGISFAGWLLGVSIALYRLAETVPDIIQGVFQRAGRMRLVAGSLFLRTIAVILTFSLFALICKRVTLSFVILAFASLVITILYDVRFARGFENIVPRFTRQTLTLAKLSFPLTIGALIGNVHLTIPRYFLNQSGRMVELGQFAALSNLMVIGMMLAQAVGTTLSPRIANHYFRRERGPFLKMAAGLLGGDILICAVVLVVTHFVGRDLLRLLYNAEISAAASALPLFVLSLLLSLFDSHFGVILTGMQIFRGQILLHLAKLFTAILLVWTVFNNEVNIYSAAKLLNWSLVSGLCVAVLLVIWGFYTHRGAPALSGETSAILGAVRAPTA